MKVVKKSYFYCSHLQPVCCERHLFSSCQLPPSHILPLHLTLPLKCRRLWQTDVQLQLHSIVFMQILMKQTKREHDVALRVWTLPLSPVCQRWILSHVSLIGSSVPLIPHSSRCTGHFVLRWKFHLLSNGSSVTTELLPSPSSPSKMVRVEEISHFQLACQTPKLEFFPQDLVPFEILIPNAVITRAQVPDHLHLSSLGLFDLTLTFSTCSWFFLKMSLWHLAFLFVILLHASIHPYIHPSIPKDRPSPICAIYNQECILFSDGRRVRGEAALRNLLLKCLYKSDWHALWIKW